jgi:hypothetical protein
MFKTTFSAIALATATLAIAQPATAWASPSPRRHPPTSSLD